MIISFFVSLLCVLMPVVTTLSIFHCLSVSNENPSMFHKTCLGTLTQYFPKNDAKFETSIWPTKYSRSHIVKEC